MALTHTRYQPKDSAITTHRITNLKRAPVVLAPGAGKIHSISILNGAGADVWLKLYSLAVPVDPTTIHPDFSIPIPSGDCLPIPIEDAELQAFSGGLQVAASLLASTSGTDPNDGVEAEVRIEET